VVFLFNGGPSRGLSEPFFLTSKVSDIVEFIYQNTCENQIVLTDLYVKKGWSLRGISKELGIHRSVVRTKLKEAEIDDFEYENPTYPKLSEKVREMRERGLSYHTIADKFNALKIKTRSNNGKWYGKTVRDIIK